MHKVALGLIGGGAIALSLSLVLGWLGIPHVLRSQIKKASRLQPNSTTLAIWTEPGIPMYRKFYFFNVTNPEEIQEGGKPSVTEMGPYTYLEKPKKKNIQTGETNLTLIYQQARTYFFVPELSSGSEQDILTYLNIPLVGVAKIITDFTEDSTIHSTFDEKIKLVDETLFKTTTIRDILFDGISTQNYIDIFKDESSLHGAKIPQPFVDGKWAFYKGKNGSIDGQYEVKIGMTDYREYGQIVHWNNLTSLPWWKDKICNEINGTDGTFFSPFLTRATLLRTYNSEMCRTIYIIYDKDLQYKEIPLYRFTWSEKIFEGKQNNINNTCYCTEQKNKNICEQNGILIMSGCSYGLPIILSTVHFYSGGGQQQQQQHLIDNIDGINPNEEKHKTYIDMEPITAITVKSAKRIQYNIHVKQYENIPTFSKLKNMIFPIMWVEEFVELPDDNLKYFGQLYMVLEVIDVGKWVMVFSSLGALGLGIICGTFKKDKVELIKQ